MYYISLSLNSLLDWLTPEELNFNQTNGAQLITIQAITLAMDMPGS